MCSFYSQEALCKEATQTAKPPKLQRDLPQEGTLHRASSSIAEKRLCKETIQERPSLIIFNRHSS